MPLGKFSAIAMTSIDFSAIREITKCREANSFLAPRPVTRSDAENAVRQILAFLGDDPTRGGLRETPARFIRNLEEAVIGQTLVPAEAAIGSPESIDQAGETLTMWRLPIFSLSEHDLSPITGTVHIAYLPGKRAATANGLVQMIGICSRRLQTQERLTNEIAESVHSALAPSGLGVVVDAAHHHVPVGFATYGPAKVRTLRMLGALHDRSALKSEFLAAIDRRNGADWECSSIVA